MDSKSEPESQIYTVSIIALTLVYLLVLFLISDPLDDHGIFGLLRNKPTKHEAIRLRAKKQKLEEKKLLKEERERIAKKLKLKEEEEKSWFQDEKEDGKDRFKKSYPPSPSETSSDWSFECGSPDSGYWEESRHYRSKKTGGFGTEKRVRVQRRFTGSRSEWQYIDDLAFQIVNIPASPGRRSPGRCSPGRCSPGGFRPRRDSPRRDSPSRNSPGMTSTTRWRQVTRRISATSSSSGGSTEYLHMRNTLGIKNSQ